LVGLGLVAALAVQVADRSPTPPLFDGVIVTEPYVWLDPPPGHPGGAQGTSETIEVRAGKNRIVAVYTPELTPQVQLLATPGTLTLPAGATSLTVTITPIEPEQPVTDGYVDGNVYEVDVVDQDGNPATAPASAGVTLIMRSADPTLVSAMIERFDGTAWLPLETSSAGPAGFLAIVTEFGEFAVVASGTSPYPTPSPAATATPIATAAAPTPTMPAPSALPTGPSDALPVPILAVGGVIAAIILIGAFIVLVRGRRDRGDW
jgi:hypothetical protein